MQPLSIKNRLSLWLILSVSVLFSLYWFATSYAPVRFTEAYVASRLEHDAQSLLVGLQLTGDGAPRIDPGYITRIYQRPFSGHYYEIRIDGQRFRSRSLWDEQLALAPQHIANSWQGRIQGPRQQSLYVWAKRYNKQGKSVLVVIAEDLALIDALIDSFHLYFTLISLGLLIVVIAVLRFVVKRGLRPLDETRAQLQRLERGELSELPRSPVPEVQPLVGQINHLLGVMRQRLERSRNAAGNLAHALKTPLAYMNQLLERDEAVPQRSRDEMARNLASINETIDRELKRARLAGQSGGGQRFDVSGEIASLIEVMQQIHGPRGVHYHYEVPSGKYYAGDSQDMLELFGNLLDNAGKWARGHVWLEIKDTQGLHFSVADDGEGVASEQRERLKSRGTRLDEQAPGHGLGLAIVQEIVRQYNGTIRFGDAERGGLRVEVQLP